jgi:hypothetical protein
MSKKELFMKKVLLLIGVISIGMWSCAFASYDYLSAPNEANRNFSTLMQHQFEKEETLDFVNSPETYKEKRENKEKFLDYQEGKVDIPQNYRTQYYLQGSRPGSNNMQFVKDENGKIRIQGIK